MFDGGCVSDLAYVALTIVFFALMLLYVSGCARLGHSEHAKSEERL